jgi:hypothetical protein
VSINLTATFKIVDRFSKPMDRMNRHMKTTERAMKSLDAKTQKTGRSMDTTARKASGFGSSLKKIGGMTRGLFGVQSAFLGIASAIGTAAASKKLFESTVLPAARIEQSNVMIEAMFDDKKLAKEYTKMLDRISVKSPILDSQGMYENSKSFITTSKDVKQLEKMWNLAERMAAIDPVAGVDSAVFALRELFSGDAMSMIERFEMPRAIMNDIKKMGLPQQLEALDKYFEKIGMTQKLIDDMGGTTLGLWQQVREQFSLLLRDMGEPSLKVLSGFFSKIITKLQSGELDKFAATGGKIIEKILGGMTSATMKIYEYFAGLSSDPEFKKRTTLFGKLDFIFQDFFEAYQKWLDDGGRDKIKSAMEGIIQLAAMSLKASEQLLIETATSIGSAVGSAMATATKDSLVSNFDSWYQNSFIGKLPINKASYSLGKWMRSKFTGGSDKEGGGPKSHASGISFVRPVNYQATLHRGERVLTPEENREYSKGNGRGGVNINIANMQVREEADINKIAYKLALYLEGEAAM